MCTTFDVAHGNDDVTIVAQIESSEAAAVADNIGAVTGIDAVFIGPFDLALASGLAPGGSELQELIRATEQRSRAAGVPVGGMAGAAESAAPLIERGLDFVLVSNDAALLKRAAHGLVEQIQVQVSNAPKGLPSESVDTRTPMASSNNGASSRLRGELEQVVIALWYKIDHHDGIEASAYFTADAQLRFHDAAFRGTAQIDEVYATRAARGPRVSRHVVTNLHVVDADDENARATSTLILYAEDGTPPRPTTTPALVADVQRPSAPSPSLAHGSAGDVAAAQREVGCDSDRRRQPWNEAPGHSGKVCASGAADLAAVVAPLVRRARLAMRPLGLILWPT